VAAPRASLTRPRGSRYGREVDQWNAAAEALEPNSSPGAAPTVIHFLGTNAFTGETSYESFLRCFVESYSFPLFHMERAIAASLRASVNFARFGLVPAASIRW